MRRVLSTGLTAAAALCLAAAVVPAASAQENVGTILGADRVDVVKDSYIVSLKADTASRAAAPGLATKYGGQVDQVWQHALNGFSVKMSATRPIALWMCSDKPSEVTMPADSCPRCCKACKPR